MSLVPGWDGRNGSPGATYGVSPKGCALSSSSSLNNAIRMKKEVEKKALEDKIAKEKRKAEAYKPVEEGHTSGWWASMDENHLNESEDVAKPKATGFVSQSALTGQIGGIGSSLFANIRREPVVDSPQTLAINSEREAPLSAPHLFDRDSAMGNSLPQKVPTVSSPSFAEPEAKGWHTKMDAEILNHGGHQDDCMDSKGKQGFTPQMFGSSGLANRLVPLADSLDTAAATVKD